MAKKKVQPQPQKEEVIEITKQLSKGEAWFEQNWKKVALGLLVLIVIAAGIYGFQHMSSKKEAKAQAAIAAAQTAFGMQQYEQALNGDGATAGFTKIMKEYSGTETANLAKLYAAVCYAQTGKIDEAIKMFEDFDQKKDATISPASIAALGNCYIQKGNNEKGVDLLLKAAKSANNDALTPVFLLQAGQVYESMNQNEKALEIYNQIKKNYFRSPISQNIDQYIERASK